jgi:hypothetical protein
VARDKIWATRVKIAKQTLNMPDAIAGVMGGPTKEQARETLRLDKEKKKAKRSATHRVNSEGRIVKKSDTLQTHAKGSCRKKRR